MYLKFQQNYYLRDTTIINKGKFETIAPIIVIDISHQNEAIQTGPIDIRIKIKTLTNIPTNISPYCIIIHDRMFEYILLTNETKNFCKYMCIYNYFKN